MPKVLIIEDDEKIREELSVFLKKYGYECESISDFTNVTDDALKSNVDIILLDINLPCCDGFYICVQIRKESEVPIIVVTSRDTDMDELMSINLGADDFITKPYNSQVLLARINRILGRNNKFANAYRIRHKGLVVDIAKSRVEFLDEVKELSKNEIRILNVLVRNSGSIVSRNEIMEELWQTNEFIDDNTLTVNISRLREKLKEIGLEDFIITKRGQGYLVI